MVSEDSTSRVMVLPVTAEMLVVKLNDEAALSLGARNGGQLTGLDEDLHLDGVWECMSMCIDERS
jgi:hypothetical protein